MHHQARLNGGKAEIDARALIALQDMVSICSKCHKATAAAGAELVQSIKDQVAGK
jgi:hypothetical protein